MACAAFAIIAAKKKKINGKIYKQSNQRKSSKSTAFPILIVIVLIIVLIVAFVFRKRLKTKPASPPISPRNSASVSSIQTLTFLVPLQYKS
jgi:hypothetical protein